MHYAARYNATVREWKCPRCRGANTGRIDQGCPRCGAGRLPQPAPPAVVIRRPASTWPTSAHLQPMPRSRCRDRIVRCRVRIDQRLRSIELLIDGIRHDLAELRVLDAETAAASADRRRRPA